MPIIPYGSTYTATVSGSSWKRVICQNCGCDFVYKITRSAEGSGSSILWRNESGAMLKAKYQAQSNLNAQLTGSFSIIHCPNCGYYQDYMVKEITSKTLSNKSTRDLILAVIIGVILFAISNYLGLYIWISIIIGLASTIFIYYLLNSNKNDKDPNQNAHTRTNQPYSEDYPVMLTSVLVQMQDDEKKAKTSNDELERKRLSKPYQLSFDDASIIKTSIIYQSNFRKILMDPLYGPSPEFGRLYELDLYKNLDSTKWQQELIDASINISGTVFEVRWSPKDKYNVIVTLQILKRGLELANKYPESAYVKYIEMINNEGTPIVSTDLQKLEEIIGRLEGLH
jgi:hypothetical protein